MIYLRSELRTKQLEGALPDLHEEILENGGLFPVAEYERLGAVEATTEICEHGIILHLVEGPNRGVVVTVDREVGSKLTGFIEACSDILNVQ